MWLSRKVRLLSAVLVPMIALAACSGGGSGGSGGGAAGGGDEPVKITVWSWDGTVERAVSGFQAANPSIKVEVVRDHVRAADDHSADHRVSRPAAVLAVGPVAGRHQGLAAAIFHP